MWLVTVANLAGKCCYWSCVAIALVVIFPQPQTDAAERTTAVPANADGFRQHVWPVLAKYCAGCHGSKDQQAELRLDQLNPDLVAGDDAERWHEVLNKLNLGEMPPPEEPQPPHDELLRAIDWLTEELERARARRAAHGAGQTLRRLNRTEYANTMRDLVGLPHDAAQHFTVDAATDGFDNVASGLSVSPLHVENYLESAQRLVELALVTGEAPPKVHFRVDYLGPPGAALAREIRGHSNGRVEPKHGPIAAGRFEGKGKTFDYDGKTFYKELETVGPPPNLHHDFIDLAGETPQTYLHWHDLIFGGETEGHPGKPERGSSVVKLRQFNYDAGIYRLRIRARGVMPETYAGPLPLLQIYLEPEKKLAQQVELSREPREIELVVYREDIPAYRARYNQRSWGVTLAFRSFSAIAGSDALRWFDVYEHRDHLYWNKDRSADKPRALGRTTALVEVPLGVHLESIEVEGPYLDVWPPEHHRRILFDSPQRDDETVYAREVLERLMTRAFRRPAVAADVDAMVALYEARRAAGDDFVKAIRAPLAAVLASPRFLYLLPPPAADEAARPLDDDELATRLSYFLWSTMPDDELLRLARRGELNRDDVLRRQVRRMLDDDRSAALVEHFGGQWLQQRKLADFQPDATLYPAFDDGLRTAMLGETRAFFAEILRRDESVLNFLDSDWAMLNQTMAHHYGIAGVLGDKYRRVPLRPEHERGGVLTQASVLTVTSNGVRTLPVQRGVFVLENLWADPPPPPPPSAGQLEETAPESETASVKERLQQHRRSATCAACHAKIDPLGFALERFDAIGQRRDRERLLVEVERQVKGETVLVPRVVAGDAVETAATLPDGRTFSDVREFKQLLLADRDRFVACLAEKLLIYALGRGVTFADEPLIEKLAQHCAASDYRLRALIEAVVLSDAFRHY